MSAPNPSVSVFHFTSRISNAKIRKYKLATERGMGPSSGNGTMANGRSESEHLAGSPTPPTPATESPPVQPPPAKKPRLKLSVRDQQQSNQDAGDTIRVSSRPKRKPSTFRYSGESIMNEPEPPTKKPKTKSKTQASPAPSSGLSSLSSAPPSDREESPFIDPPAAPVSADYGDFMAYYITGGDDEDEAGKKGKAKPKGKSRAKANSKVDSETPKSKAPTPVEPPAKPAEKAHQAPPPPQAQQPAQPAPPPQQQPPHNARPPLPPPPQQRPPPPPQQRPGQPHIPPPFPPGPPMYRGPPLPPAPPRLPQPIINFIDIGHDPRPTTQDTVADMVHKLIDLSSALTNFGGVPAIPPTPPQAKAKPVSSKAVPPPSAKSKPAPKPPAETSNEVDFLLSHFNDDDDDDDDESEASAGVNYVQPNPGRLDGPLTYGIEFIQNALKSWAQQRMTHQVTQQWQAQQQQQIHQQQLQAQRRGPGRPRRYDEPNLLTGPPPIIHMDLAQTPEGVAIKNFQSILDSGCLQVNGIMPIELSRALRHLYMQIDHLINQGSKNNDNWQCMSYQAQINAHKLRLDKWKEQQKKAREEMERQQQIANEQVMAQMGLQPHQMLPQTAEQAQQAHEMQLERRRSMQHAAQQPYISQQHLNPLQLGQSGTPKANGSSPPPSREGVKPSQSAPATTMTPAPASASAASPSQPNDGNRSEIADADPNDPNAKGSQVHLDKMKLYMPGFLPRSGQSMKFSFAPHSDAAVQAFGPDSFPANEPGSSLPNRGPMSAPPASHAPSADVPNGTNSAAVDGPAKARPGDAASPIQIDSDTPAEQAFGSEEAQINSNTQQGQKTPSVGTGGFNPINAPSARPSSVPADSPDTIRVAMKHPSGALSASGCPAPNNGVSVSTTTGVPRVTNFPA